MELIYVVCQLAAANVCEEHRVAMLAPSPTACVFAAPAELAQLVTPGWRVTRWTCAEPATGLAGMPADPLVRD
jgi:hypothetical protein